LLLKLLAQLKKQRQRSSHELPFFFRDNLKALPIQDKLKLQIKPKQYKKKQNIDVVASLEV
jgi:hypothetical protein